MRARSTLYVVMIGLVVFLVGCTTTDGGRTEVLVSAAASLSDAFTEMETVFEESNHEVDVLLNFAGSSTLREQILGGAPIDVFASANIPNMELVVNAGLAGADPEVFAHNQLQIAVAPGNPAGITGLSDFGRFELLLGVCARGVPCGDFAREVLAGAGVEPLLDTNEPDVRSLITKIEAGELDAGIVYVSDVVAAGGAVEGVGIPDEHNIVARYPIVVLADAPHPEAASDFVDFALSEGGRSILQHHGFTAP
ncbi:MAG TPA: molybdate ABC transporter substrate-binding protein [Acidimicrobiia bacterium]|nr:molybdate ABC transporter substrate-binding protein [Acidimicrobiia bacterium]